jgi:hypothetical protein
MRFTSGEMVVKLSDLRVGFVTRIEESETSARYRVMFQGGESGPLVPEDLARPGDL